MEERCLYALAHGCALAMPWVESCGAGTAEFRLPHINSLIKFSGQGAITNKFLLHLEKLNRLMPVAWSGKNAGWDLISGRTVHLSSRPLLWPITTLPEARRNPC